MSMVVSTAYIEYTWGPVSLCFIAGTPKAYYYISCKRQDRTGRYRGANLRSAVCNLGVVAGSGVETRDNGTPAVTGFGLRHSEFKFVSG